MNPSERDEEASKAPPITLNEQIEVMTFGSKVIITTTSILAIIAVFWAFFGSVPLKIYGNGLVVTSEGLFNVESHTTGSVANINVTLGQSIKKGDLIATIIDPALELKLQDARALTDKVQKDLDNLTAQIERENTKLQKAYAIELEAKQAKITNLEKSIIISRQTAERKKKLYTAGLIALSTVLTAYNAVENQENELETAKADLYNTKLNMVKAYRETELMNKRKELDDKKLAQRLLELEKQRGKITSPYSGKVLSLLVNPGDHIKEGEALVWFEKETEDVKKNYLIYGYVSIREGKRINKGDYVEFEVSQVNTNQFGVILGKIQNISPFAKSVEEIASELSNPNLAKFLLGDKSVAIQVTIQPKLNSKNVSGFEWSSGYGPPLKIETGTTGKIKTTVENIRPLYYLIPIKSLKVETQSENTSISVS